MSEHSKRMEFVLNERKAAQAAAVLLKAHGRPLSKTILIKLLYLAERRALAETGRPIIGDRAFSLNNSPVLSETLNAINEASRSPSFQKIWSEYVFRINNSHLRLAKSDPETDELSRFELRVLAETYAHFGSLGYNAIIAHTHSLPEWRDPKDSRLPIDPVDILRFEEWPDDAIEAVIKDTEEMASLERLLASAQ